MEIPAPVVEQLLDSWPVARLATLGPDGRPHQVPIVFARHADVLYSPIDGKRKRGGELVRIRNARSRPDVSLLLDHYGSDWQRLWWLRIDGHARVIEPRDPEEDAELAPVLAALRAKYSQYQKVPLLADPPTLLAIRIVGRSSWCSTGEAILEP